jgi:hypothetical protein
MHEHVVELLIRIASLNVEEHETKDGAKIIPPLSSKLSKIATATFS